MSAGQGQGKSTLIEAICDDGERIKKLNLQTSRETLTEWGYSLDEVNRYLPLKKRFQEKLYQRHCEALGEALEKSEKTGEVLFVERTFSDIFAYTVLGMGAFNDYSDWLEGYKNDCMHAQATFFDHIVFLTGRVYVPEADGVRSTNTDFSDTAGYLIEKYTHEFTGGNDGVGHVSTIDVADLGERVTVLDNTIHQLRLSRS
jgi:hypothetical protein